MWYVLTIALLINAEGTHVIREHMQSSAIADNLIYMQSTSLPATPKTVPESSVRSRHVKDIVIEASEILPNHCKCVNADTDLKSNSRARSSTVLETFNIIANLRVILKKNFRHVRN